MAIAKNTGAMITLIRGRKYTLIHPFNRRSGAYQFEKGVPLRIEDQEVVEFARGLMDSVVDGDGAEIHKPMFSISPVVADHSAGGTTTRSAIRARRKL